MSLMKITQIFRTGDPRLDKDIKPVELNFPNVGLSLAIFSAHWAANHPNT